MKRQNNVPFTHSATPKGVAPVYKQVPARVPKEFMEAMKRIPSKAADYANIRTPEPTAKTQPKTKKAQSSANKWRSSFKPLGDEDDDGDDGDDGGNDDDAANDQSSSGKVELYNPYDPGSPDSEIEKKDYNRSSSEQNQDHKLERQRLSPGISCRDNNRWDSTFSEPGSRHFVRRDFFPEPRTTESQGLSSGHRLPERQAYSPHAETLDRPVFGSLSRDVDHRICSPDMIIHSSSPQECLASYGGQKANGEERIRVLEHRREMTTVRLSPPKVQHDSKHHLGLKEKGQDPVTPATEVTRNRIKTVMMDESPVTCDLCDVELANGQELEDHLDSKNHWVTLEYIQQNNNYDDLAIAFLQDVMIYKSRHCSRAIEDSALLALQENDHMTKVEMFHCAACNIFVSTSALSVQTHITSQEHLANTREFGVQQRRTCLEKAGTIMKELKPQFELFVKGDKPFE
ncbi:DBIRD complex subunit ZNF326 isoform X1 [Solea senegalensis]|uniref:DBIRD complex subunit ZNF326 isoform X1 n=1 Tax=Solea senegalensis TaxID=28829 RepID=A0AAV6TAS9_SOLSE|nr:uncharacterized protein LOC122768215 isoform X2 [Solea senegalensis]KAG7526081.1 DBIRD complex subunit ZNF326 isoform X1 [Solea senegalensis]